MMRSGHKFGNRRWLTRPDMLIAAAGGVLASAFVLLLVPSAGTLLLEILVGLAMVGRAWVFRRRERAAAQLCLDLPITGKRLRLPDRYELALIIVVILGYGALAPALRSLKMPELFIRTLPIVIFASGLLAKNHVVRVIMSRVHRFRPRVDAKTRTVPAVREEAR
jgi:hypothetical protein